MSKVERKIARVARDDVDELLNRIASYLEKHDIVDEQHLYDAVALEILVGDYRDGRSPKELGLRTEVKIKNRIKISSPDKEEIQHLVNCLVLRKEYDYTEFIERLRAYLGRRIPIAKLFGERDRTNRNGVSPWVDDCLGYIAEETLEYIKREDYPSLKARVRHTAGEFDLISRRNLTTSNTSLKNSGNLYQLLQNLTDKKILNKSLINKHTLHKNCDLRGLINFIDDETRDASVSFVSAARWRDCHKKYRQITQIVK